MEITEIFISMCGMICITIFSVLFKNGYIKDSLWFFSFGVACILVVLVVEIAFKPHEYRGKHFKK